MKCCLLLVGQLIEFSKFCCRICIRLCKRIAFGVPAKAIAEVIVTTSPLAVGLLPTVAMLT